jgi:hypothetical protein
VYQEREVEVEKIIEKIVYQDIPVERVVVKEVPIEVEKVVTREIPIPMEKVEFYRVMEMMRAFLIHTFFLSQSSRLLLRRFLWKKS